MSGGAEELVNGRDATGKHPLAHRWTLWFDNPNGKQRADAYGQTLKAVHTFGTVEDFWCLYDNIRPPSRLQPNATYYLFKEFVIPKWEDANCKNGGCWNANVPKNPGAKDTLDSWWLYAVLACIGEQFDDAEEICGVCVKNRRSQERIELWTAHSEEEEAQARVARQFKAALGLGEAIHIGYVMFQDKLTVASGGVLAKPQDKYVV